MAGPRFTASRRTLAALRPGATAAAPPVDPAASAAADGNGGTAPAAGGSATPGGPGATIVVQAAGSVASPGVYTLPEGSRVHELVAAAGGPVGEADVSVLALASVLVDGQRVYVPTADEAAARHLGRAGRRVGPDPLGPVDLNRATVEQLDALPGIGPSTAHAIVDHRARNGPFSSVEDLTSVRGIGPAKLDAIRDQVTV
ncbi:MAG: helix-hairpin-helix domain-containing protein [Ilumatobacteraceae bacterium]